MKVGNRLGVISGFILITLLFLLPTCDRPGDEIDIPTGPVPTVESLVESGWNVYQAGDYREAKNQFWSAVNRDVFYKEAYLGLGWALNRLSDYNNAIPKFDLLLTLVTESDNEFKLLSFAGKALSFAGMNSDSLSCIQVQLYLDISDQDYVFEYDERVVTANMKKLLLNGYWNYQDYYSVQNTIADHFEPDWFDDLVIADDNLNETVDSSVFIIVEIEVDTSVAPNDTTILSARIELFEDYNVLEVSGITDSLYNIYPVKKFSHGGNVIHIDVSAMENISMLLDDLTQEVKVSFVRAEDYGKYLNTLFLKVQSLY